MFDYEIVQNLQDWFFERRSASSMLSVFSLHVDLNSISDSLGQLELDGISKTVDEVASAWSLGSGGSSFEIGIQIKWHNLVGVAFAQAECILDPLTNLFREIRGRFALGAKLGCGICSLDDKLISEILSPDLVLFSRVIRAVELSLAAAIRHSEGRALFRIDPRNFKASTDPKWHIRTGIS